MEALAASSIPARLPRPPASRTGPTRLSDRARAACGPPPLVQQEAPAKPVCGDSTRSSAQLGNYGNATFPMHNVPEFLSRTQQVETLTGSRDRARANPGSRGAGLHRWAGHGHVTPTSRGRSSPGWNPVKSQVLFPKSG